MSLDRRSIFKGAASAAMLAAAGLARYQSGPVRVGLMLPKPAIPGKKFEV